MFPSCIRRSRSGGTLIEVMAAVALLGGIFASSLRATSRMVRMQSDATEKLLAVHELDDLLSGWMFEGNVPIDSEGEIANTNWVWKTTASPASLKNLSINRVDVVVVSKESDSVLASCEIIVSTDSVQPDSGFDLDIPDADRRERLLGP